MTSVEALSEFLEVCVHQILWARKLYPEVLFQQRSKYGTSVWQAVHPAVGSYVSQVLSNARAVFASGPPSRLIISINGPAPQLHLLETFSISCSLRHFVGGANMHWADDLEAEMRAVLLKIFLEGHRLSPLPQDSSFALCLATQECETEKERTALDAALRSRNWVADNNTERLDAAVAGGSVSVVTQFVRTAFVDNLCLTVSTFPPSPSHQHQQQHFHR
jgi:mitotic spindle assembly checkpoint protein MAD2B